MGVWCEKVLGKWEKIENSIYKASMDGMAFRHLYVEGINLDGCAASFDMRNNQMSINWGRATVYSPTD